MTIPGKPDYSYPDNPIKELDHVTLCPHETTYLGNYKFSNQGGGNVHISCTKLVFEEKEQDGYNSQLIDENKKLKKRLDWIAKYASSLKREDFIWDLLEGVAKGEID